MDKLSIVFIAQHDEFVDAIAAAFREQKSISVTKLDLRKCRCHGLVTMLASAATTKCTEAKATKKTSKRKQTAPAISGNCANDTVIPLGTAIVSPANSLLEMDGGVDLPLSRTVFPGIQDRLCERLRQDSSLVDYSLANGRRYLPIGSAMVTRVNTAQIAQGTWSTCCDTKLERKTTGTVTGGESTSCYLISAPTMLIPQAVDGTQNAYFAFGAALSAVLKYNSGINHKQSAIQRVWCPGMCTGCGKMSYRESADQMYRAYKDIKAGLFPAVDLSGEHDLYLAEPNKQEQPRLPANKAFF